MDENALRDEIKQSREAETKAKAQIYTLRGKKGLQAMAAAMGEEVPPQLMETVPIYEDPEDSPQIQELRRQIALLREMEKQQLEQIEELKQRKSDREKHDSKPQLMEMPQVSNTNFAVQQASTSNISLEKKEAPTQPEKTPSYADFSDEQNSRSVAQEPTKVPSYAQGVAAPITVEPSSNPPPSAVKAPSIEKLPQTTASPSSSGIVSPRSKQSSGIKKGKKDKVSMQAPESLETKVLNASWDSGAVKSKKTNKVSHFSFPIIIFF